MEINQVRYSEFKNFHPLVNLIFFILVIGITMFSNNPLYVIATFIFSFLYSIYLKGKKGAVFNLLCIIPMIIFMVLINAFFIHEGNTILFYIGDSPITMEAVFFGICATLLFSAVIIWFSCFNVILTSDKLIYLFGRITPVLGLTISMIFRFIPLLKKRYREIKIGQHAMGRTTVAKGFLGKIRQASKEISILISWSLEASIETADSMEARGYGLKGRTSFNPFVFTKKDWTTFIFILIFGMLPLVYCILGNTSMSFYPKFQLQPLDYFDCIVLVSYCILMVIPVIVDIKEELKWKRLNSKI